MRNIVELLEIMLKHKDLYKTGLCGWAEDLAYESIITYDEKERLRDFIQQNPPGLWSFDRIWYWAGDSDGFYWEYGEIAPRLRWIKRHINLLTKKK